MSNISINQGAEFCARYLRMGGTVKQFQTLLGNDELMQWWMDQLNGHTTFKRIHGVYNSAEDIVAALKARCEEKGIDFAGFSWVGPETAPDFDMKDPETVVVLDATLGSLEDTFEFVWEWTKDGQADSWRWDGLRSDPDKLRLLQGSPAFEPWTLRWRRIKLNTHVGKKPMDVRSPETSPGLALLFVAAEHPARIQATDYETKFGWFIPGLECTEPAGEPWRHVPYVGFVRSDRRVRLHSSWCGDGGLAVPVFRE